MRLLKTLFLFYLFGVVLCESSWDQWKDFKKTYNKLYLNEIEENYRRSIFLNNLNLIENHNEKYEQGLVTYSVGINKFADYKIEELHTPSRSSVRRTDKTKKLAVPKNEIPESIDWRDYGVITPIVDQLFCYTCWAFAVVAALEAHVGIHLGHKNQTLSEENLSDCIYSDFECQQEMRRTALEDCYQYIIVNGINTAETYPYDQKVDECRYKPENIGATIKDYANIPEGDEEELKAVVGTLGPVAVMITVQRSFMLYSRGVYYQEDCNNVKEPYNHAVTVIGYGEENGEEYWLVKNEWSTIFGDQGYIKMARNKDNMCGIASYASYPIL